MRKVRGRPLDGFPLRRARPNERDERGERLVSRAEVSGLVAALERTLDELETRSHLQHEILERTSDAVFAKDLDGRYVLVNPRAAAMLGKAVREVIGLDDRALFPREDAAAIMALDREVMERREPRVLEENLVFQGEPVALVTTKVPWIDDQGRLLGLIGIARDVTELRRDEREAAHLQDRLRAMASEIVMAEEGLRRSLAAELHRGLAQDIALIRMELSALRRAAGPRLHGALGSLERLSEQAERSVRAISVQLGPPPLHDLGLVAGLQWLAEDIGSRYGLDVRIEDAGSPPATDERARVILFRAVREILVHAASHGRARTVRVRIDGDGGLLRVTVVDEGADFGGEALDPARDGLFESREQLRHVGGSMEIDSVRGRGTLVRLRVPPSVERPEFGASGA